MNRKPPQPPTIREQLGTFIYGRKKLTHEREAMTTLMRAAVKEANEVWSPGSQVFQEHIREVLQESDAYWDIISSLDPNFAIGVGVGMESERLATVSRSRLAWRNDPITQWIVQTWTNFAFGENVQMTIIDSTTDTADASVPLDEEPPVTLYMVAENVLQEFWRADRNHYVLSQDRLQRLSDLTLVDGELYLILYISTLDGEATIRYAPTDEISEIVTEKGDSTVPVYYKRQYTDTEAKTGTRTVYYQDWLTAIDTDGKGKPELLPKDAVTAETLQPSTFVCMIQVGINVKTGMRGWPLMTAGLPWAREHKRFREARAAVAQGIAQFIQKLKTSGGSRAVDSMRAVLQSSMVNTGYSETNPPAVGGSTFLENQSATLERLPLTTGAGDARTDGEGLLHMAALGGGLFPHWAGVGDAYRLATATAMEAPLMREFSRYQNFWAAQFRSVGRVVLWAKDTWGGTQYDGLDNPDLANDIDVSTDRLVEVDLVAISGAISELYDSTLVPLLELGAISPQIVQEITAFVWLNALQALGAPNPSQMANVQKFKPQPRPASLPTDQPPGDETPAPEETPVPSEAFGAFTKAINEFSARLAVIGQRRR